VFDIDYDSVVRWDDLTFAEDGHVYRHAGITVPSVTTALKFSFPMYMRDVDRLAYSGQFGDHIHRCIDLDDKGVLDEASVWPEARPYLDAWRGWRERVNPVFLLSERRVYSERRRYAGTLDKLAVLDGEIWILDAKSGVPMPSFGPQTAAYENCILEKVAPLLDVDQFLRIRRASIFLQSNGVAKFVPYEDKQDYAVFLAALTIYHFKRRHNVDR
jgi:hypothetical protein